MQMENKLDKITSVLPLDISSTVSLTDYSIKNFNTSCFRSELALLTHYLYVAGDNTSCASSSSQVQFDIPTKGTLLVSQIVS
jgi:hypothetical protein